MSESSETPWSSGPFAPKISYRSHMSEKRDFTGVLLGAIVYGIVIVLFFRCMSALLCSAKETGRIIKWIFVAHTATMFTFVTIFTATSIQFHSAAYINNREFSGTDEAPYPGPVGYQVVVINAISLISNIMFYLNNWLADGLLLYRFCVIYSMNYWVIAFPCLMYLASLATCIMIAYENSRPISFLATHNVVANFGTPFYAISFSLNILLTFMIIARLFVHNRNLRRSMGHLVKPDSLYKIVATLLIESFSIYAVSFVLYIVPWAASSSVANIFFPPLAGMQVIAPFLIILRVANRTAVTTDFTGSGVASSIRFGTRGKSSVYPMSSLGSGTEGETPGDIHSGVEVTSGEVPP